MKERFTKRPFRDPSLFSSKTVNCPVGYFFNSSSCQVCAIDEYQDQEAQTSCISCPTRTSTFGQQGSKQRHDCQGNWPYLWTFIDTKCFRVQRFTSIGKAENSSLLTKLNTNYSWGSKSGQTSNLYAVDTILNPNQIPLWRLAWGGLEKMVGNVWCLWFVSIW